MLTAVLVLALVLLVLVELKVRATGIRLFLTLLFFIVAVIGGLNFGTKIGEANVKNTYGRQFALIVSDLYELSSKGKHEQVNDRLQKLNQQIGKAVMSEEGLARLINETSQPQ